MSIFPKTFSALITPRGGASSKAESTVYSTVQFATNPGRFDPVSFRPGYNFCNPFFLSFFLPLRLNPRGGRQTGHYPTILWL